MLVFQFLLTLEFVKALSDMVRKIDMMSSSLSVCTVFLVVSVGTGVCVGFASTDPVMRENVCIIDATVKTGSVVKR